MFSSSSEGSGTGLRDTMEFQIPRTQVRWPTREVAWAMVASTQLLDFFLGEIDAEERDGFPRLSRVPDSQVAAKLADYRSLNNDERRAFRDCCAHWACACYGFVLNAAPIDHTRHPFFPRWKAAGSDVVFRMGHSVPMLRAAVQQYKVDARRGVRSCVSEEDFKIASSIRSVKAPELRKRVKAALRPLGYQRIDELGYYRCRSNDREFLVHVDYGASSISQGITGAVYTSLGFIESASAVRSDGSRESC
jgi:hypothetical protein